MNHVPTCCRIVVTGGPGGGKTTAADIFRRELGHSVAIVPEAATMLYAGGFPRTSYKAAQKITQRAIYHVQKDLEDVQAAHYQSRILICDRGTVDGAAYWPGEAPEFFSFMKTTPEAELSRYDAVIFFETAAAGGGAIEGGNPFRIETPEEAIEIDKRLRALWSKHSNFVLVPHHKSFFQKLTAGFSALEAMVKKLQQGKP